KPALKIFFPPSGGAAVVLIDVDREGEPGFGLPDIIEKVYSLTSVQDIIRQGTLVDALFQEKSAQKDRTVPPIEVFKIEIAKVDQPINVWEKAPTDVGYIVPFKYVTATGDNYNVRIKFKAPKITSDSEAEAHAHSEYMMVEYIEKEYTTAGNRYQASQGAVTEYYRPKKEFAGLVKAQVVYEDDTKKLDFIFPDGNEITGFVTSGENKFIESTPYAKAYAEGGKRFWIETSGGTVYDKRKHVSPPKELVGEYFDTDTDTDSGAAESTDSGMADMDKKNKCGYDILNSQMVCKDDKKPQ